MSMEATFETLKAKITELYEEEKNKNGGATILIRTASGEEFVLLHVSLGPTALGAGEIIWLTCRQAARRVHIPWTPQIGLIADYDMEKQSQCPTFLRR